MGGNDSKSESKPLTGADRADAYNWGTASIANTVGDSGLFANGRLNTDKLGYTAPEHMSLNNGDYAALEKNIVTSRTAPLDEAWRKSRETINQDAADRGIWSSGMPVKNEQDFYAREFLPAYQQAGADAAIQRYSMQQQDLQNRNSASMENANRRYESMWRPLDYAQGLYNQTGGVISSGNSSGWSI